jgi:hypothetical protein
MMLRILEKYLKNMTPGVDLGMPLKVETTFYPCMIARDD